MFVAALAAELGRPVTQLRPVAGGCDAEALEATLGEGEGRLFVKLGAQEDLPKLQAEAAGLRALSAAGVRAPQPLQSGVAAGRAFLAMEFIEFAADGSDEALGAAVAALHCTQGTRFGFDTDNWCGAGAQSNAWSEDWCDFFCSRRVGARVAAIGDDKLAALWDRILPAVPRLFADCGPVTPALIHGDLWSGNWGFAPDPVLFDPCPYFAHAEAELSIMTMFGEPGLAFWSAYHDVHPRAPGFADRQVLYKLYHWLNHMHIFGAAYAGECVAGMERLAGVLGV